LTRATETVALGTIEQSKALSMETPTIAWVTSLALKSAPDVTMAWTAPSVTTSGWRMA
jgi:hypothetical protein